MTIQTKNPPGEEADGPLECQLLADVDARLWTIREELFGDLDEIRIYAERTLKALDVENDLDLGRAFDQSVKHFCAVAANLETLILVKTGARQ